MHADICDPSDKAAVERFRKALIQLGAKVEDQTWGIGVDLYRVKIGDDELAVFSDTWSIDIQGDDELVKRVLQVYEHTLI